MFDMLRYVNKLQTFVTIGDRLAELSTCKRRRVAAIMFPIDCANVYSIGYNGPPSGIPNDNCTGVKGDCGCVHAEMNALVKFNADSARPSIMYCTCMPCLACASLLLNCRNVVGLIYGDAYHDPRGIELLIRVAYVSVLPVYCLQGTLNETTQSVLTRWKTML